MTAAIATATLAMEDFRLLREMILRYCGVMLADDQRGHVERRLRERLTVLAMLDFRAYYRYLRFDPGGPAELEDAAEAITTHETYFLREEYQLRAFCREVLPGPPARRKPPQTDWRERLQRLTGIDLDISACSAAELGGRVCSGGAAV